MYTLRIQQYNRTIAKASAGTAEAATALETALETQASDRLEVGYFDCILSEDGVGVIDAWISVH